MKAYLPVHKYIYVRMYNSSTYIAMTKLYNNTNSH